MTRDLPTCEDKSDNGWRELVVDGEITTRFAREKLGINELSVTAQGSAFTLAWAIAEAVGGIRLVESPGAVRLSWFDLVDRKTEVWPIEYLLPNGAYVH